MDSKYVLVLCLYTLVISSSWSAPTDIFDNVAYERSFRQNTRKGQQSRTGSNTNENDDEIEPIRSDEVDSRSLFNSLPGRRPKWYDNWGYQYQNEQLLGYDGSLHWKPQSYQIARPYIVPVFGADPRKYIYFPPQPVDVYYSRPNAINPGIPPDNPLKPPFAGPTYLPPSTKKPLMPNNNSTFTRFGDYDDLPVWPVAPVDQPDQAPNWGLVTTTQRPQTRPTRPSSKMVPTRPPRPPSIANPPLVHDIESGTNQLSAIDEPDFPRRPERPTSPPSRPRPSSTTTVRTTTIRTTARPRPTSTSASAPKLPNNGLSQLGPSNCVWAVVSCCSAATNIAPEGCFEQRGCPGPFWDRSPCDKEFADSAIQRALEFYGQGR